MRDLEIPEAAYIAGAAAYDEADFDSRWLEAIKAAAPLIVAAELRRIARKLSREWEVVADMLIERAGELDPEGLTK